MIWYYDTIFSLGNLLNMAKEINVKSKNEKPLAVQRDDRGRLLPGSRCNPSGRPATDREVAALARQHGAAAIAKLADIMSDPDMDPGTVIRAAQVILDRAYGRPPQSVDIHATRIDLGRLHLEALQNFKAPAIEHGPDVDR